VFFFSFSIQCDVIKDVNICAREREHLKVSVSIVSTLQMQRHRRQWHGAEADQGARGTDERACEFRDASDA
jgi:hypothetical protein